MFEFFLEYGSRMGEWYTGQPFGYIRELGKIFIKASSDFAISAREISCLKNTKQLKYLVIMAVLSTEARVDYSCPWSWRNLFNISIVPCVNVYFHYISCIMMWRKWTRLWINLSASNRKNEDLLQGQIKKKKKDLEGAIFLESKLFGRVNLKRESNIGWAAASLYARYYS